MFNRPKGLSPDGACPKRAPFTDLQNVTNQDEAKDSKGLDNFDWNRKLNLKKTEKVRHVRPKKKFVLKIAEEKDNEENYSPNSRTTFAAFGKKSSPATSVASRRSDCKDSAELTDEDISISYEDSSPRYQTKDLQHENLLRIAHALSPQSAASTLTPPSIRGPPTNMVSPPPTRTHPRSCQLIGSPLLNVTKREVELSPQTPDMSVSPSQQVTPPTAHHLDDDFSESKSARTSKEEKSSALSDDYQQEYNASDYHEQYDDYHEYHEQQEEYSEEYPADHDSHFQITNQEYFTDIHQEIPEEKQPETNYMTTASLQALTPVKLRASMTVVTEEVHETKALVDSPDSASSKVTSLSTDMEIEQLFSKVRHNRIAEVKESLDQGTNTRIKDANGNSLLHICAQNNLKKMASLVLDYGADINAENKKGTTALDYCDNYHFDKLGDWFVQNGGDNGHANLRL